VPPQGCAGLLPIPRRSGKLDSATHLQSPRLLALTKRSGPTQQTRTDALGSSLPSLEQVDSAPTHSASIVRERKNGGAPCRRVRDMAADKLFTLESRIPDLQSWRRDLRTTLANWDSLLAKTPRGKRARLLELGCNSPEEPHSKVKSWSAGAR
jgi:hypothetical protein